MRTPIIAGNWKMHTTLAEALALADALEPRLRALGGVECVLCPPFPWLTPLRDRLAGTGIGLGAQNAHFEPKGAYTGEVSAPMLAGLVDYVIIGHSERRQYFGETDEIVKRKLEAVLAQGLAPILCVGENLAENEAGQTAQVIERQVRGALDGLDAAPGLVVAYEPVWAIGTGRPATAAGANEVAGLIRGLLAETLGGGVAAETRIQYGGSVNPGNFGEFIAQPEIDGGLVGGASLKADSFFEICRLAAPR